MVVVTGLTAARMLEIQEELLARTVGYVAGSGRIERAEIFGHSYMGVSWIPPALENEQLLDSMESFAVGGSTVQGNHVDHMIPVTGSLLRPADEDPIQLAIVMHGINDIAFTGPLDQAFDQAMRSLISALRTAPGKYFRPATGLVFTGGWQGPYAPLHDVHYTVTDGTFKWTSPADWAGGWVVFHLYSGGAPGWGGLNTFTMDGAPAGSVQTIDADNPLAVGIRAHRVWVPAGAGHEIINSVTGVNTGAYLWGYGYERSEPPLVMLLKQPRLPSYSAYAGFFHVPTDADVVAANLRIDALAAEYGPHVQVVDLDSVFNKSELAFNPDKLHPIYPFGTDLIVAATWSAIREAAVVSDRPFYRA